MSRENPTWAGPRIHGEPRKLGLYIAETSVSKYPVRRRPSPGTLDAATCFEAATGSSATTSLTNIAPPENISCILSEPRPVCQQGAQATTTGPEPPLPTFRLPMPAPTPAAFGAESISENYRICRSRVGQPEGT